MDSSIIFGCLKFASQIYNDESGTSLEEEADCPWDIRPSGYTAQTEEARVCLFFARDCKQDMPLF